MKKLFCLNLTDDVNNQVSDEQPLVVKTISQELETRIDDVSKKANEKNAKRIIPFWVNIMRYVGIMGFFIITLVIINGLMENASLFIQKFFYFIIIDAVLLAAFVCSAFIEKKFVKKAKDDPETIALNDECDNLIKDAQDELMIPTDAQLMDVLACQYKEKADHDEIVKMGVLEFVNMEKYLYKDNENIYISDLFHVIAIAIKSITNIEKIEKKIVLPIWNKAEPFKSEQYKAYNIKINGMGYLVIPSYYIVNITDENDSYRLFIPNYEFETLDQMIKNM